jgi:hypothetical protein
VFQGQVENPKAPQSGLSYASEKEFLGAFQKVSSELFQANSAALIAKSLEAFLTPKYYYMFGGGVEGYKGYILGNQSGIGQGLSPHVASIELWDGPAKKISVAP